MSLIIIGEETNKVNKAIKRKYGQLSWELMSGMRNKMVHNYDGVDTSIVWKTVKIDISGLKKEIETIFYNEKELLDNE